MKIKMQEKAKRFPGNIDVLRINHVKSLREFDDLYTAPMHGYKNAIDYWKRASSKPQLKNTTVPTSLLNDRNDPFIPEPSLTGSNDCCQSILAHLPAERGHGGVVTGSFTGQT